MAIAELVEHWVSDREVAGCGSIPKLKYVVDKKFLKFFWCSRLALRNHSGATQKTNFIADVSLLRNN